MGTVSELRARLEGLGKARHQALISLIDCMTFEAQAEVDLLCDPTNGEASRRYVECAQAREAAEVVASKASKAYASAIFSETVQAMQRGANVGG